MNFLPSIDLVDYVGKTDDHYDEVSQTDLVDSENDGENDGPVTLWKHNIYEYCSN